MLHQRQFLFSSSYQTPLFNKSLDMRPFDECVDFVYPGESQYSKATPVSTPEATRPTPVSSPETCEVVCVSSAELAMPNFPSSPESIRASSASSVELPTYTSLSTPKCVSTASTQNTEIASPVSFTPNPDTLSSCFSPQVADCISPTTSAVSAEPPSPYIVSSSECESLSPVPSPRSSSDSSIPTIVSISEVYEPTSVSNSDCYIVSSLPASNPLTTTNLSDNMCFKPTPPSDSGYVYTKDLPEAKPMSSRHIVPSINDFYKPTLQAIPENPGSASVENSKFSQATFVSSSDVPGLMVPSHESQAPILFPRYEYSRPNTLPRYPYPRPNEYFMPTALSNYAYSRAISVPSTEYSRLAPVSYHDFSTSGFGPNNSVQSSQPSVNDFQKNLLNEAASHAVGATTLRITDILSPPQNPLSPGDNSQPSSPQFQSPSPDSGGARSRHASSESIGSPYNKDERNGKLLSINPDHRQKTHKNSEHKRRCNIKCGFDLLHQLVPSLSQNPNVKVSKAATLQKSAEYCQKLKVERQHMQEEAEQLKKEIEALNNDISICQSQLPATGVPVTRQRADQAREMFDKYVKDRTLQNWKFWIFSIIIRPLFESFNNMVSTASLDELCRTVLTWLEQHCSLVVLRPGVLNSLRHLSTTTSILSDPSKVPEQAALAVTKNMEDKS